MRLLSLLLQYPDADLLEARPQLVSAVRALPHSPERQPLEEFTDWYAGMADTDLAAHYVQTFDLRRKSSLYLTYYLHGDTRRRGVALLEFKQRYRAAGLVPPDGELPDYLPVICEFAAIAGPGDGEAPLRQHRQGLELIRAGLRDCRSPYRLLLDALCAMLPDLPSKEAGLVTSLALAGPPAELVGLTPYAGSDSGKEARR
jgi:nitrate reductase delta subunit